MLRSFQLRVTMLDDGNPEKVATAAVTIPVTRNVNAPKFSNSNYENTVNENIDVGLSILKVSATDADQDTITFEIPPTDEQTQRHAIQYFFVTPDTGQVHLKESLMNDDTRVTQYRVIQI